MIWRRWINSFTVFTIHRTTKDLSKSIRGLEWVHCLFLFPLLLGIMYSVVVKCKIESFSCSLDNLFQKNVIVFFFGNQISKWRSFEKKKVIFDLLFTFFSHQGKVTKIPSTHISITYIHVFCSPYWLFCLTNFEKKNTNLSGISLVWVLVLILIRAILEQSINNKMVSKKLLMHVYTNAKFIVICKPWILNDGGEVQYRNRKKHCFLAAAILLFIGKSIIT